MTSLAKGCGTAENTRTFARMDLSANRRRQPYMNNFSHQQLRKIGRKIFTAGGASPDEAALVTDVLVDANLMGLDSHGIIRVVWYMDDLLNNKIQPGAPLTVSRESTTTAVLDGGGNFGAVAAMQAVNLAAEKAKQHHLGCTTVSNCHHMARLGAFAEVVARQHNMICLATASWSIAGHFVSPWGGREPRLTTNPFAYAIPTDHDPFILDMSTSAISEGKIRLFRNQGEELPDNFVLDAEGVVTRDPNDFYGPPGGTILPFGGVHGFKGFGLGMLVEVLSNTLSGHLATAENPYGQRACFLVIDPGQFAPPTEFKTAIEQLKSYMKSSAPAQGYDEVILPGEYHFRRKARREREGIPLDPETWDQIVETARRVGVEIDNTVED
jgi:uncharacterized oxidoreductase